MTTEASVPLPPRYEVVARLGKGGGGEVWRVRDRVNGRALALKTLSDDAGEAEVLALVREAVTLSGLEGLGVPRVVGFGRLPRTKRRYLVRELVEGRSLADVLASAEGPWLSPLATAADQLTTLHRAGLFHGDVKPANVIAGDDGRGTLVDLGLATPWREGGARVKGLTPRYAAPELFAGEPLTVRAEVFSLGATLAEALDARGGELDAKTRRELARIAERATADDPQKRQPSVDELASALRAAAKIATPARALVWPVAGVEASAEALVDRVGRLPAGASLALVGPSRSGRTTLARRLAWSLAVRGVPVAFLEDPTSAEGVRLELEAWTEGGAVADGLVVVVDDLDAYGGDAREELRGAAAAGARLVSVVLAGERGLADGLSSKPPAIFEVPRLEPSAARDLVRRAVPSMPDALVGRLIERADLRPGALRRFVMRLGERAVTSEAEVDALLDGTPSSAPAAAPAARMPRILGLLDRGRFDEAKELLDAAPDPEDDDDAITLAVAHARVLMARGEAVEAGQLLDRVAHRAADGAARRAWEATRARVFLRTADFARAITHADHASLGDPTVEGASIADALSVAGVARAFSNDPSALTVLGRAVRAADASGNARAVAIARGSLAIAHQRAGRTRDARVEYEAALEAAERAEDAWTIATTRLNLAGLAKGDGDLARALLHLEAAVDMGRRTGGLMGVQQALFNLANLDLYLGRYARAAASIADLAERREELAKGARAQLLGLEAEHAARTGDLARAATLYERCGAAYDDASRPLDAAEARLESMLVLLGGRGTAPDRALADAAPRELAALERRLGEGGFREHEALSFLVRGTAALARGDDGEAKELLDRALASAEASGQREWLWQAHDARARLAASQNAWALARRDTEAALALLEETAAKLPRDLREVFWNDPRRRVLREAHTSTQPTAAPFTPIEPFRDLPRELAPAGDRDARRSRAATLTGAVITSMGAPLPAEDRLARIFEITRDLAREHDLARLLERVLDHAIGLVGAERGLVVLVDDEGKPAAHTARGSKGEDAHHTFSRSVAERVVREGEPVVVTSAKDDERLASAVSVHQLMIQSIACVPIRGASHAATTIGALYLETRLRPGVRFREELPTLAAFADQAAIAIESARLLDENARRAEQLARANEELEDAKARVEELLGRRTEQLATARRDLKEARAHLRSHFGYGGLVGTSAPMRRLYALLERVKDAEVPVLVTGESGTGKEVVARALHSTGPRAKQPFLGVNCGAIPENLLESELFGHVRGAFTGADRDRKGLFREAEGGTLLLDEVGEMPLKMQAGLLRVLQERTVRPIGGVREEPCDVRVVAATNRDLAQMVAEGTFREDLFYRLHVVELKVPALRERLEDVPPLIDHFLGIFAARHKRDRKAMSRAAVRRLASFDWPGNVRQLEHVLLNAWLLAEGDEIEEEDLDLPSPVTRLSSPPPASRSTSVRPARVRTHDEHKDAEKDRILAALTQAGWNRVQAAKLAGIPRRTFYRRLKDYGIV